jgi:hypothetical protein
VPRWLLTVVATPWWKKPLPIFSVVAGKAPTTSIMSMNANTVVVNFIAEPPFVLAARVRRLDGLE